MCIRYPGILGNPGILCRKGGFLRMAPTTSMYTLIVDCARNLSRETAKYTNVCLLTGNGCIWCLLQKDTKCLTPV